MGKIIAANFKSNKNREETKQYLDKLELYLEKGDYKSDIYVFPSHSSLLNDAYKNITLGAQNCYHALSGAFTGEITLNQLEHFNIYSILVGHSERRYLFHEDDKICKAKFDFFKQHNLKIFYCIGEDSNTRNSSNVGDFLKRQLEYIDLDYSNLVIAYEPIWAIGTGITASIEQILEIMELLKFICKMPIIYGGSVNEGNAKDILKVSDGLLVGSASLEFDKFIAMI